jgi:hypothetical protein
VDWAEYGETKMKPLAVALSVFALATDAWAVAFPEPLASCEPCRLEEIADWECLEASEMFDIVEALGATLGPDTSAEVRAATKYLISYASELISTFDSRKARIKEYYGRYSLVLPQRCPNFVYR